MSSKAQTPDIEELDKLTKTVTIQMTPGQYERLFFQPSAPRGDLALRFANPTLLGLIGFLIPFQSTMFSLLGFRGAGASSITSISGSFYFIGGIAMNLAGIADFVLGNTFPCAVWVIYGCHWCNVAYTNDPLHNIVGAYGTNGMESKPYNSGQGLYNLTMSIVSAIFLVGSLRTNIPLASAFFGLIFVFGFTAAAYFQIANVTTTKSLEYATTLLRIAGGFGFVTIVAGWYLAIISACAATDMPCPLPVGDLGSRILSRTQRVEAATEAQH